jgi:hypothetical protein
MDKHLAKLLEETEEEKLAKLIVKPKKSFAIKVGMWAIAIMIAILLSVAGYAFTHPRALVYLNSPFSLILPGKEIQDKHIYKHGETVLFIIHRCNFSPYPLHYLLEAHIKNIETKQTYFLEKFPEVMEPGCQRAVSDRHVIPNDLPPGNYKIAGTGSYEDVNVSWDSKPFEVK